MPSDGEYLVTSRKNFLTGYLKKLSEKLWTKIQKIFTFFSHFFFTLNSSYLTNHNTYAPNFFTRNTTLYLPHFGINSSFLPFLVLELEFFKNCSKFFENKKFKCCITALAMFWIGNPWYMSSTCVALLVVWRGYYRDETHCIFHFTKKVGKGYEF